MERKKLSVPISAPRKKLAPVDSRYEKHLRRRVLLSDATDIRTAMAELEMELSRTLRPNARDEIKMALIRLREDYEKASGEALPYKPYWAEGGDYQSRMVVED